MAITEYYVDPSIDANSGAGTIGDPYGDLQYALGSVTRDATNGDRFNIKSGTAEVLTAPLDFTSYGSPTVTAPAVLQGYSATQGDGGIGDIDCNGGKLIAPAVLHVHFLDMRLGGSNSNQMIALDDVSRCVFHNVEFYTSGGPDSITIRDATFRRCRTTDFGRIRIQGSGLFLDCEFNVEQSNNIAIGVSPGVAIVQRCTFSLLAAGAHGVHVLTAGRYSVDSCSFWSNGGSNTRAITVQDSTTTTVMANGWITNNIIVDLSGTDAIGIENPGYPLGFYGNNAFFNNTTNKSLTGLVLAQVDDIELTTNPFRDAASGDFALTPYAARQLGWPEEFYSEATRQYLGLGAAHSELFNFHKLRGRTREL